MAAMTPVVLVLSASQSFQVKEATTRVPIPPLHRVPNCGVALRHVRVEFGAGVDGMGVGVVRPTSR